MINKRGLITMIFIILLVIILISAGLLFFSITSNNVKINAGDVVLNVKYNDTNNKLSLNTKITDNAQTNNSINQSLTNVTDTENISVSN